MFLRMPASQLGNFDCSVSRQTAIFSVPREAGWLINQFLFICGPAKPVMLELYAQMQTSKFGYRHNSHDLVSRHGAGLDMGVTLFLRWRLKSTTKKSRQKHLSFSLVYKGGTEVLILFKVWIKLSFIILLWTMVFHSHCCFVVFIINK